MSGDADSARSRRPRTVAIVTGAVVAVVVVAGIVWGLTASGAASGPTGTPTATTSSSTPSSSPSTTPSSTTPAPLPVPPSELPQLPPVSPDSPAPTSDGIGVRITKMEAVVGEANLPGEVSGPAVRYTIEIENNTDQPFDLTYTTVNAYIGADLAPALNIIKPGGSPFAGVVEPGASATGVYVFRVAPDARGDVIVTVDYRPGTPAAVFRGAAPSA